MRAALGTWLARRRRSGSAWVPLLVLGLLAFLLPPSSPARGSHTPGAAQQSLWADTATPAGFGRDDLGGDTLGVRFRAARSGTIDGLEYYRPPNDTSTHTLSLWTNDGTKLASASVTTSSAGWEHALFSTPVQIAADTLYVASVHSPAGYYSQTVSYFSSAYTNGDLTAVQDTVSTPNGVFTYGPEAFPTQTWGSSNYWIDVLFTPATTDPGGGGGGGGVEATQGSWEVLSYQTSFVSIHAAVMRTQKMLLMGGSENNPDNLAAGRLYAEVWDSALGTLTRVPPTYDLFCSAHAFLPDGRLLIAGGTLAYPDPAYPAVGSYYKGSKKAVIFNPIRQRFEKAPSMARGRWYPTLTALGDGRVHAISGLDENAQVNTVPEIYTPGSGWTTRPPVSPDWPLYPALILLDNGRLFYTGASVDNYSIGVLPPGLLDPNTSQFTPVSGLSHRDRREAASVLLPPAQAQRVMIIGGGDPAVRNVDIIDTKAANPAYTAGPPLRTGRLHLSAVLLPDGKVLATGGGAFGRGHSPVLEADIYDPATNAWTAVANPTVGREYHSIAMLLPDGRVATAGSQPDYAMPGELRIEVYSPPYLFKGPRPVIASAPTNVSYGGSASVGIGGGEQEAATITALRLVRPMAVTHSLDTEQRVVDLPFTRSGTTLQATIPTERNLAPPGWYMLFAVDDQGIPSIARWVRVN